MLPEKRVQQGQRHGRTAFAYQGYEHDVTCQFARFDDSESVAIQSCRGLLINCELRFDGLVSVGCSLSGSVVGAVPMGAGR